MRGRINDATSRKVNCVIPISLPLLAHLTLATLVAFRVLYRKLDVNTTLAWAVVLFAFPLVGIGLYLLFGRYRAGRRRRQIHQRIQSDFQQAFHLNPSMTPAQSEIPARFSALAKAARTQVGFPIQAGNTYQFLTDPGIILETMRADIDRCETTCCLEFYIIEANGRVTDVLEAVERAAKRGVACRILADDLGSSAFFRSPWADRLRQAGVSLVRSLRVGLPRALFKRSDLRNHRKLLLCDHRVGYVGSSNLVDPQLFKANRHVGQWVDTMIRAEGPIVDALTCMFYTDLMLDRQAPGTSSADPPPMLRPPLRQAKSQSGTLMQLLPSGPEMGRSYIYDFMISAIYNARHRVRIVTPYFIPDPALLLALNSACARGIQVELVVPERADSRLSQYASQASYAGLLETGILIQRYQPGLLHTKAVLIDTDVSVFGTVNLDPRSFYLNLEVSLILYGSDANTDLDKVIDAYVSESQQLDANQWAKRSGWTRFLENTLRLTGPLL